MKTMSKILFAPVIAVMWFLVKAGSVITYFSGLILGILSAIFGIVSIIFFATGNIHNGLIGIVITYLLCPYGIPMFLIMTMGAIQKMRVDLQGRIYG